MLQPEPLSPQQATADPWLCGRHSNTQREVWLSFFGVIGSWYTHTNLVCTGTQKALQTLWLNDPAQFLTSKWTCNFRGKESHFRIIYIQFSSHAQSCLTLCNPMDCSMSGFCVHHQFLVLAKTHPLSQGCHPTISSSIVPFSFCLQSFPALGSTPKSQHFPIGGQSIGLSASVSVLPMNIQYRFPLRLTGWISLQSKVL